MRVIAAKIAHRLWYMLASLIILVALLVTMMRWLTPVLNEHRTDFEKLASDLLQMPVMIREVAVSWHGYSPQISLDSVTVLDPDTQKPKISMQHLAVAFNIWRSLWTRQLSVHNITVSGINLIITQAATGTVQIGELTSLNIKDSLTGSSVQADKVFSWVFSQPQLELQDISIKFISPVNPDRLLSLNSLMLENIDKHHIVDGKAILNQSLPIKMHVHADWQGDVRKPTETQGNSYVYFEGLSLPQWFGKMSWENVQVKNGLASIKIWSSWDHNEWKKIQSTFQMYGIELYSELQQRSEVIDRFSGNVGWRRDKESQVISGDNITIDFPYHLWPVTHFYLVVSPDKDGNPTLNNLQFNYLNLGDVAKMLELTDALLSDELRQELMTLTPQGEISNLTATATTPAAITDIPALTLKGTFAGLTVNAWRQFPGITNFKGQVAWIQNKGSLKLDCSHVFLRDNEYFKKPLYFDQLTGDFTFNKADDGSWAMTAKNMDVSNSDISASANFSASQAANDTPVVDFTADFNITHAAQFAAYFPEKALDPDLAKWLHTAFRKGEGINGKAIVKGNTKNFPFDNNTGSFSVTMQLKDMDLFYDPDWPVISNIDGNVNFTGRVLTINLLSSQMLGIPMKNIVATIPYIGDDAPQILHVNGSLATDLSQVLSFINNTPLKKTIGQDLEGMDITGGDTMKLGLILPLRHPEKATVTGDVVMTNATLNIPQLKLAMNKINGGFQFTDSTLSAKNITAELLGVPATLNITTVLDKKQTVQQIKATLNSSTSVPALETWTGTSLSKILQGSANYQANVILSDPKITGKQITISSDLKGIAVNLPAPYAKKAGETGSLQLNIISDKSDLKTKLSYNKKISAAVTFDNATKSLQIKSGEVRLGTTGADWQTKPGIIISGDVAQLNWDTWQDYFKSLHPDSASNKTFPPKDFKLLREVDLGIKSFKIMNQQLNDVQIKLTSDVQDWQIDLSSRELVGDITVPFDLSASPVLGKFQRINFSNVPNGKSTKIDPRTLPSIELVSEETQIGDADLGRVVLSLQHSADGIIIRNLQITDDLLNFNASGSWEKSSTHLQGEMTTTKVSDLLNQWGFNSSNFIGSKGDVKFDLSWPDAPYLMTVNGMSGAASFNLGKGRIIELSDSSNAKIGLGRMLNLFSLSTLQRRLNLDFSDVTQKGYSFDSMTGDFTLKNGSAYTNNMKFNGPIAKVEIKGRVGLSAKDFDVQLAVTPYITGSLPVVAAFAGGPIVGVAALLVDKVVTSGVAKIITYHFTVTGPWANPVTTSVTSSAAATTSTRR